MLKICVLLFALLAGSVSSALADPAPKQFVIANSEIVPIKSKITGRDHELVVLLPASYAANPQKTYPVLYYLDAYWDTPLLVSTYGNLVYDNEVPEFIMVGMSYPNGADYGRERAIDYTFSSQGPGSGKGALFLDFLMKEVAPLIETRYRGAKTDRVVGGSSLAGLFAIESAYKAPGFFAGHVAISPAVFWDRNALAKIDETYAKDNKSLNARMFVSYGTAEYPLFRDPIIAFQKQLSARQYEGFGLMNYTMDGLDHAAVKGEGYTRGLMWVWKARKPSGPSGLTRMYTGGR